MLQVHTTVTVGQAYSRPGPGFSAHPRPMTTGGETFLQDAASFSEIAEIVLKDVSLRFLPLVFALFSLAVAPGNGFQNQRAQSGGVVLARQFAFRVQVMLTNYRTQRAQP